MKIDVLRQKQVLEFCKSCLNSYLNYLSEEEVLFISSLLENKIISEDEKNRLLSIAEKIWNNELATGKYIVVSWSKFAGQKHKKFITFATLSLKDDITSFCDSDLGLEYDISFKSIIGALNKDGATLVEDIEKRNEYTIALLNNKAINSYNGATKLITPAQLLDKSDNTYNSKHNELILDSNLIVEKGEIDLSKSKISSTKI